MLTTFMNPPVRREAQRDGPGRLRPGQRGAYGKGRVLPHQVGVVELVEVEPVGLAGSVKGFGLPFAGHKDNHAGLMNPTQAHALRDAMRVKEGEEWEPLAGLGGNEKPGVEAVLDRVRTAREKRPRSFGQLSVPAIPAPQGEEQPRTLLEQGRLYTSWLYGSQYQKLWDRFSPEMRQTFEIRASGGAPRT